MSTYLAHQLLPFSPPSATHLLPLQLHQHELLLVVSLQRGEDPHLERRVVADYRAHVVEAVVDCRFAGSAA